VRSGCYTLDVQNKCGFTVEVECL